MSEIDLGVKAKDKYNLGEPMPEGNEKIYPHFHYCGPIELDLPDEGEMTIRFKKRTETSEIEEDGSHWYECKIEVRKILKVDGEDTEVEAPANSRDDAGDALDAIRDRLAEHFEKDEREEEKMNASLKSINERLGSGDSDNDDNGY